MDQLPMRHATTANLLRILALGVVAFHIILVLRLVREEDFAIAVQALLICVPVPAALLSVARHVEARSSRHTDGPG